MEQSREPLSKTTHVYPTDFWQRYQEHTWGKTVSSINSVGKPDGHMQKDEI